MKVWDKLWRRERGRRKTVVYANLKRTSTKYDVMCKAMLGKI